MFKIKPFYKIPTIPSLYDDEVWTLINEKAVPILVLSMLFNRHRKSINIIYRKLQRLMSSYVWIEIST